MDKGKNIMNNGHVSTKHSINNNYKGDEMDREKKQQNPASKNRSSISPHTQEQQKVPETQVPEQMDVTQSEVASSSMQELQNKSTIVSLIDTDKEKQTPAQPTGEITLQMGDEPRLESKGGQLDSPSHLSESSLGSDYSKFESNGDQSGGKCAKTPPDSNGNSSSFEKIDKEPLITITNSNGGNSQSANEERSAVFQIPGDSPLSNDDEKESLLGKANEDDSAFKSNSPEDIQSETSVPKGGAGNVFTEGDQSAPTPTPEPIPSLTSKKSEQVNNTIPQNTKSSNLHAIAASILAIAGVALGVTTAVHLEMLAAGIVVGAYCLVAAAVMYHYKWPSSFIENNQIEKVAPNEKKEPIATSV
ncbi:TomO hydrophobic C-terminal domain-containing protein [Wolbachia endosymbiont of Mansonella perstans]|uniref:TomO hydrophobic C-terminal domain-containing protein n=1 Tax=Wolbachia endosymbiont of Mansonella perstans TaxID=229526 RepID=UPI001CE0A6AA|nr:hypothetical protein [Wolbachia endosymbiont of Mansonella perstans]MCA4773888.1 hypothetical protein [Wolbachia endosymbiont of Mansonella perstans]